ncbi:30S ribosomal protein S2 [Candidatus Daviesbacteria bacterium RIFCSPHIGHO2_02_FULL_36_13]|uniref:Small ribosomal subunit protein uS2 n=1 Tax=Candidatus Daviesbacteria bacterium RIFCSPHIGHO2_02_FULL_36_13 TaxID=1797768 RepID=A0A1F5JS02_9BACT|nr:MAG: 30S ribosomal protein S2 [Candidatus Daviesbacteria bacterium RIFCSPHIGHO2_02_FULL_36_13]OGE42228.1 MAG: 30S ribosomal protein S2 [Candidatus Daviesbacteria bacterium RIFCSPLOWO2_01_FULL_36_8]
MYQLPKIEELLEAGVHFGHQIRRGHPRMKPYIYGAREGVHIIDLTKSEIYLKEACEYVYSLGKEGKVLLFVGTKKQARPIVEELAKNLKTPYLIERWIGGFLTNFEQMQKNLKILKEFKEAKEKGNLKKYTKKEQLLLDRKMNKLDRDFEGVMELGILPDAVFVSDAVTENIAVKEANRMGIKVVAIADSNCNPSQIDYPIPGNDDAIKSIKILLEAVAGAYAEGKKEAGVVAERAAKQAEKDAAKKAADDKELDETLKVEVAAAEESLEKKAVKDSEKVV